MKDQRDRNRDRMRRHDDVLAAIDVIEVDTGDGELPFIDATRLREIDGDEFVLGAALDPFAISGGGTAEENEIEIFELVIGDRRHDGRLIADVGYRALLFAGRIEQHDALERKRAL